MTQPPSCRFFSGFRLAICKMVIKITHGIVVMLKWETAWQMKSNSQDSNFKGEWEIEEEERQRLSFTSSPATSRIKQCFWVPIFKVVIQFNHTPALLPLTLKPENTCQGRETSHSPAFQLLSYYEHRGKFYFHVLACGLFKQKTKNRDLI